MFVISLGDLVNFSSQFQHSSFIRVRADLMQCQNIMMHPAAGAISIENEKVRQQGGKKPPRMGGWSAGGGETILYGFPLSALSGGCQWLWLPRAVKAPQAIQ